MNGRNRGNSITNSRAESKLQIIDIHTPNRRPDEESDPHTQVLTPDHQYGIDFKMDAKNKGDNPA